MTFRITPRLPLALLALLGGLAAATATAQDDGDPAPACFPAAIDGFETIVRTEDQAARLKANRNTVSGGYHAASGNTVITVFVYDREPGADDRREGEAAIAEVLSAHSGSELASSGEGSVALAGVPTPAHGGFFTWSEGETDYGSFLWVIPREAHYVKIRATYVRPEDDREVAAAMRVAMNALEKVARGICDPG